MTLLLASQSSARAAMLEAAGVAFEAVAANVDEEALKAAFARQHLSPRDIADALAEAEGVKCRRASTRATSSSAAIRSSRWPTGRSWTSPDREDARDHLAAMSGGRHPYSAP